MHYIEGNKKGKILIESSSPENENETKPPQQFLVCVKADAALSTRGHQYNRKTQQENSEENFFG
jgi:hypothetical protein